MPDDFDKAVNGAVSSFTLSIAKVVGVLVLLIVLVIFGLYFAIKALF